MPARIASREASIPEIRYPDLPVSDRRDDLVAAIRAEQVLIVAGETGSGKTTQLPKMCLEAGQGRTGMIGHTQPRRLAARTVAERIASELDTPLGELVGYTVRFTDQVSDSTLIKVMTDGILLAEIQRDPLLRRYDTLIVDEAHERSLNIDFLLGYLKTLLPRRDDLKLIITSATIDTERFAKHFDAPVIEVSGRSYPVEIRYRPAEDQVDGISDAVDELLREGPGDILVFLSGEREIRDTAEMLTRRELRDTEVVPLYARLSGAEQHRVFEPHRGRRIVLATNVAETSLTVPGIRYVVDPGTARISRYSARTKVQRLPIEAISQASANQRAGRCGRVAAGVCIRLYAEEDFDERPAFTDPEILRTNLASVILQMATAGLGEIGDFPFLDPPDARSVADGVALLEELGALHPRVGTGPTRERGVSRPTALGRQLAQLPVDPRLGRMVLEAGRLNCVREVMVIAAALSIQDPRERPVDAGAAPAEAHARFVDRDSDFFSYLALWEYLREQQEALGSSQFRRMCRREYLNYLRIREWQDLYAQLRQVARPLGLRPSHEPAPRNHVHQALLSGLLSQIGVREGERTEYLGARNARFAVFPGSALARKPPRWVMAGELVETSRLWARDVARIEPVWAERLGAHLLVHHYSEPHWDRDAAAVMGWERATLFGVPVVARRRIPYARVDPDEARELFVRRALIEGDWDAPDDVFDANRALVDELAARRGDLGIGDETLWRFYDQRIPTDVVSGRHFESWWKKVARRTPDLLRLRTDDVVPPEDQHHLDPDAFPRTWRQGNLALALSYQFEPGLADDGVSVHIPLPLLNQVRADGFDWQVPGLREELVTEVIRSLPKEIRRAFVPVPDYVSAFLSRAGPDDGPLLGSLGRVLPALTGSPIPPSSWRLDRVPEHLRVTFVVETSDGEVLATSKDLGALQARLAPIVRRVVAAATGIHEVRGQTSWTFGTIPVSVRAPVAGGQVHGFPALVDEATSVGLRVFASSAEASSSMWAGTRRLLLLTVPPLERRLQPRLTNATKLALSTSPHTEITELWEDATLAGVEHLLGRFGGPVRHEEAWERLHAAVRAGIDDTVLSIARQVGEALQVARNIETRMAEMHAPALAPALLDIAGQIGGLLYPGFVAATGVDRLEDLARYLHAIERRLDALAVDVGRDRARMVRVQRLETTYRTAIGAGYPAGNESQSRAGGGSQSRASGGNQSQASGRGGRPAAGGAQDRREVRWLLEELRVSLFAQSLGTRVPVSEERVRRAIDALA